MVKERRSYSESHEPHREPLNLQGRRGNNLHELARRTNPRPIKSRTSGESHPGEGHHPHGLAHVISSVRHGITSGARSFDHYCKDTVSVTERQRIGLP